MASIKDENARMRFESALLLAAALERIVDDEQRVF